MEKTSNPSIITLLCQIYKCRKRISLHTCELAKYFAVQPSRKYVLNRYHMSTVECTYQPQTIVVRCRRQQII